MDDKRDLSFQSTKRQDRILPEDSFGDWKWREGLAELMVPIIGGLYRDGINILIYGKSLVNQSPVEIMKAHRFARQSDDNELSELETFPMLQFIDSLNLADCEIDIGELAIKYPNFSKLKNDTSGLSEYINVELADVINAESSRPKSPKDIVLYGFGRIGRLLARELMSKLGKGSQLRLRAIVTRGKIDQNMLDKRASLLRIDSVHGDFLGTVQTDIENESLIINGTTVKMISANQPEDIDYTQYGINDALIIDNTGAFRDQIALERHLVAKGASKVLLTAPGKGIPNIVHGVNHKKFNPKKIDIFSAASCTTNAITPVLKVLEDTYGIKKGHLETIHAYTNDQNLVDNVHSKYRRGRAAALNMVITETGAGKAVAKALPMLEGKLTSNAIRVPVPNGSLAILNLQLRSVTSADSVNATLKQNALEGELVEQIQFSLDNELVSSDIIGTTAPAIFDSKSTISDGDTVVLYVWYDNEYGYSHQVIRLAKYIANVRRYTYY